MGRGFTADHADAYALGHSFARAYKMAGITDPRRQVDVAELYVPFSNTEYHSIEAAGLADPGEAVAGVNEGRFSLQKLVRTMAEAPARSFGLYPRKGAIQVGSDADFTVVDLARRGVVRSADLEAKTGFTMFEGDLLWGLPVLTVVRGAVVMRDGQVVGRGGHGLWIRPTR